MIELPTIDELRRKCKKAPYYHGFGMIILIMGKDRRGIKHKYHFYSKDIPAVARSLHNHRSEFDSVTLKGAIRNLFYDYEVVEHEASHEALETDCLAGKPPRIIHPNVEMTFTGEEIQGVGDDHTHQRGDVHTFDLAADHVVTKIGFDQRHQDKTCLVFREKSIPYQCVLKNKGVEKENWEMIEATLKG
jgi:hypothetical protein